MRRPSRGAGAALLAGLILLLGAGADANPEERKFLIPIEEFLPAETAVFVTIPDGRTALDLLARTGDDAAAIAARLERLSGGKAKAGPLLAALASAADAPVSLAIVPERLPGRAPQSDLLVDLSTRVKGERLARAAGEFVRSLFGPAWFEGVTEERIMELPVFHFRGKEHELFFADSRGHVLVATSAFLMGRVLKEMQGPSGKTLRYEKDFEPARARARAKDGETFVYVRHVAFPDPLRVLGADRVEGILARDGEGWRDEMRVVPAGAGLVADLADGRSVPASFGATADGAWLGADLTPQGALRLALALGPADAGTTLVKLDAFAAGPAEALWRPGRAPVLRFPLKDGAGADAVAAAFAPYGRVRDGSLYVTDPEAGAVPAGEAGAKVDGGAGALKAPVAALLGLCGRGAGAAAKGRTRWTITKEEGGATVTTGRLEIGPSAVVIASLIR